MRRDTVVVRRVRERGERAEGKDDNWPAATAAGDTCPERTAAQPPAHSTSVPLLPSLAAAAPCHAAARPSLIGCCGQVTVLPQTAPTHPELTQEHSLCAAFRETRSPPASFQKTLLKNLDAKF